MMQHHNAVDQKSIKKLETDDGRKSVERCFISCAGDEEEGDAQWRTSATTTRKHITDISDFRLKFRE